MTNSKIEIRLRGIFSVIDQNDREITPRSKRAKGLLALLAEGNQMKRSRRWLEDKLWPPNAVQARRSLRTELYGIRKVFGDLSDILQSDRSYVWLDEARVETDLSDVLNPAEFLEGLSINHNVFEDWHRDIQAKYSAPISSPPSVQAPKRSLIIQCGNPHVATPKTTTLTKVVDDQIGKIISEFVVSSNCSTTAKQADLLIQSSMQETDAGCILLVQVIDPSADRLIHSSHVSSADGGNFLTSQKALGRLCWDVADRALEKFSFKLDPSNPLGMRSRYTQQALRGVLTFDKTDMMQSVSLLDEAHRNIPDGLFLALKAWTQMSMIMEEFIPENAETVGAISDLLHQAVDRSKDCSLVAAIAANVQAVLFEDFDDVLSHARQSLRDNPNNIFAMQATAVCRARNGDMNSAYRTSRLCRDIASNSKFEPMCNLYHSLVCIEADKHLEALACSQDAADFAPKYRAPKRQIIALGALNGRPDLAMQNAKALKKIEPEFEVNRLLHDERYPSHTLRRAGLLANSEKIALATTD